MVNRPTYEELVQRIEELEKEAAKHKKINEALRESEERFHILFNNMSIGVALVDKDGYILTANEADCQFLGYSREEIKGMHFTEFTYSEDLDLDSTHYEELVKGDRQYYSTDKRYLRKDGKIVWGRLNVSLVKDNAEKPLYTIISCEDIDKRKRAEEEKERLQAKLYRSQKIESLGLLAGGVAHDLNNVLSGIVSYPELILMDLPEDSKLRKPIETMQQSGHRAVAIVRDLLTVARGVATTKEPLNINDIVDEYLDSPEFDKLKLFHPTVTVKTNLDTDLLNINGSHIHIRKVLMNLVSNASEAIEGRGNVIISTKNYYADRPLRGYDDINIGEYAILAVSDNGPGISTDDLERIF